MRGHGSCLIGRTSSATVRPRRRAAQGLERYVFLLLARASRPDLNGGRADRASYAIQRQQYRYLQMHVVCHVCVLRQTEVKLQADVRPPTGGGN